MPDLEVIVFNQKIKLSYRDNEKERLINAVEILNQNWKKFSYLQGKVSDIKIITLISLELQDSIANSQLSKDNINTKDLKIESLQKEIENKNMEINDNSSTLKKYELELSEKNDEVLKTKNFLDEIYDELVEIKNNILNKNHE